MKFVVKKKKTKHEETTKTSSIKFKYSPICDNSIIYNKYISTKT